MASPPVEADSHSRLSLVLIPALEKIIKNASWRKGHSKLAHQCKALIDRLSDRSSAFSTLDPPSPDSSSSLPGPLYDGSGSDLSLADSESILLPLISAASSVSLKIAEPALDCIQKLISHSYLHSEADPSTGPDARLLASLIESVYRWHSLVDDAMSSSSSRPSSPPSPPPPYASTVTPSSKSSAPATISTSAPRTPSTRPLPVAIFFLLRTGKNPALDTPSPCRRTVPFRPESSPTVASPKPRPPDLNDDIISPLDPAESTAAKPPASIDLQIYSQTQSSLHYRLRCLRSSVFPPINVTSKPAPPCRLSSIVATMITDHRRHPHASSVVSHTPLSLLTEVPPPQPADQSPIGPYYRNRCHGRSSCPASPFHRSNQPR